MKWIHERVVEVKKMPISWSDEKLLQQLMPKNEKFLFTEILLLFCEMMQHQVIEKPMLRFVNIRGVLKQSVQVKILAFEPCKSHQVQVNTVYLDVHGKKLSTCRKNCTVLLFNISIELSNESKALKEDGIVVQPDTIEDNIRAYDELVAKILQCDIHVVMSQKIIPLYIQVMLRVNNILTIDKLAQKNIGTIFHDENGLHNVDAVEYITGATIQSSIYSEFNSRHLGRLESLNIETIQGRRKWKLVGNADPLRCPCVCSVILQGPDRSMLEHLEAIVRVGLQDLLDFSH